MRIAGPELVNVLTQALSDRPEILDAYLFGSQARGTARADSDVDVAVYLDPATDINAGFGVDAAIATDLMRALGRNDIDVVLLNRADPVLCFGMAFACSRAIHEQLRGVKATPCLATSTSCHS